MSKLSHLDLLCLKIKKRFLTLSLPLQTSLLSLKKLYFLYLLSADINKKSSVKGSKSEGFQRSFLLLFHCFENRFEKRSSILEQFQDSVKTLEIRQTRSSTPEVFLGSKFIVYVALQLYWNHTSAWVFFCKFAAFASKYLFLRTFLDGCF